MSKVKQTHIKVFAASSATDLTTQYEAWRATAGEKTWVTVIPLKDYDIAVFYMD